VTTLCPVLWPGHGTHTANWAWVKRIESVHMNSPTALVSVASGQQHSALQIEAIRSCPNFSFRGVDIEVNLLAFLSIAGNPQLS
jgi:hypothetical protein